MAGRIRAEDVEAVRDRSDIVKVVGEYLTLKKAGADSWVGLCPFHSEKTGSFSVSPAKQVYYCFGCQAGGDVVGFVQQIEHLTFRESVETLARGIGYTLRYEGDDPAARKASSRRQALYSANEQAAELYHRTLLDADVASQARSYLAERGITADAIERFQIGVAPPQADFLLRTLAAKLGPDLLVEAGLASKDPRGTIRDRFRGRITFPIADLSGRHIGFGGRVLPGSDQPAKYVNTSETPIYRKSGVLYNLHRAKSAAGRQGDVFVVEGYTDVIALAQAGVEAVVATCGTALTQEHVRLLSRFAKRAILTFDGDEAGARAAEKAYAFHEQAQIDLVVLIIPGGKDPADLVRTEGAQAFLNLANGARPVVEYMIRRITDRADHSTVEGRSRAIDEALPLLQGLTDPVRRSQYAHLLADLSGVSDAAMLDKLSRVRPERPQPGVSAATPARAVPAGKRDVGDRVETEMLKVLAQDVVAFERYAPLVTPEHFANPQHRDWLGALLEAKGDLRSLIATAQGLDEPGQGSTAAPGHASPPANPAPQLLRLSVEPLEGEPGPVYAEGVWLRLEQLRLQRQRDEARMLLQRRNPVTDPDYDDLFKELVELDGALRRLRQSHA